MNMTRRNVLHALGLAGGSLYLPSLTQAAPMIPKRLLMFLTWHSSPYQNWKMRRPGLSENADHEFDLKALAQADFSMAYQPLWEFRSKLLILDALSNAANLIQDNPQGHNGGPATLLTSSTYDRNGAKMVVGGTTIKSTGPSVDQMIAQRIGVAGRLRSIEMGSNLIDNYGCIWQAAGQSLPILRTPAQVWSRLFPNGTTPGPTPPPTGGPPTRDDKIAAGRASVLDFTQARYAKMATKVSASDKQRLDSHRQMLRDLELRLSGAGAGGSAYYSASCPTMVASPGAGTALRDKIDGFGKLVSLAFACDVTRVASIQLDKMAIGDFGGPAGMDVHQDMAHHGTDAQKIMMMGKYYQTHAAQLAGILRQLDAIREPDGTTVLDNTIVVWANECGSWEHQTAHLPIVVAGGGGFKMGRYVRWGGADPNVGVGGGGNGERYQRIGPPHSRLLVSLARQFGLDINQVGNITSAKGQTCVGPLDRLT